LIMIANGAFQLLHGQRIISHMYHSFHFKRG
jgi:hypothetical protein